MDDPDAGGMLAILGLALVVIIFGGHLFQVLWAWFVSWLGL